MSGRRRRRPPLALAVLGALVGASALLPVVYLFVRSAGGAEAWELLASSRTLGILWRTLLIIATVTAFSALVAVPMAWLSVRADIPGRRLITIAAALPLVIPSFVMATTAIQLYGSRGVIQGFLSPLGVERLPGIYGLGGATLVLVLTTYPYIYLTVRGSLRRLDPSLEEAARAMGYGAVRTFLFVTVPMLKPAVAAGALLVALYTLSDFGAVALLRYQTFTAAIYLQYESSVNRALAAGLSMVLVVLAVALLAGEGFTRGRARYHRSTAGAVREGRLVDMGPWKLPALGMAMMPIAAGLLMPVALLSYWLVRGLVNDQVMAPLAAPVWNSVTVSLMAAGVTVAAAIPVAVLSVRYRSMWTRLLERVTYIGFGLPGVVVALSLVFFGVNVALFLYQTTWMLVFAYMVLFLPAAMGAVRSSLLQVSPRVEEAAASLGRSPWQVFSSVTFPLVMPGVLSGAALVFLLTMKELPATLILSPIGFKTLSTAIWSAATEAFFARTAAASLLLIVVSGVPTAYFVLRRQERGSS